MSVSTQYIPYIDRYEWKDGTPDAQVTAKTYVQNQKLKQIKLYSQSARFIAV